MEASEKKVHEKSPDFSDPRVVDLWLSIRKGNFTEEEINGFRVSWHTSVDTETFVLSYIQGSFIKKIKCALASKT